MRTECAGPQFADRRIVNVAISFSQGFHVALLVFFSDLLGEQKLIEGYSIFLYKKIIYIDDSYS